MQPLYTQPIPGSILRQFEPPSDIPPNHLALILGFVLLVRLERREQQTGVEEAI